MSTAHELLDNYQHLISGLNLIPGSRGIFDVNVNDNPLFSKFDVDRHANKGEVLEAFTNLVGPDVPRYHDN